MKATSGYTERANVIQYY
ncbi:unnamed protein product, partial [Mesorhabditis spiculigera]